MYFSTSLTFALEMLIFKSFGTECKFVTHNDEVLRKHLPVLSNKVEDLSCFLEGTRSIGKLLKKIREKLLSLLHLRQSLGVNYVHV